MPISRVEDVLVIIHRAEPIGVAATSPQEALLIQLEILKKSQSIPTGTKRVIQEGIGLLSRHHYAQLGKSLDLPANQIEEIAQFIGANLNPYPARAHWGNIRQGSEIQPQVYHRPDIIIRFLEDHPESAFIVEILFPIRSLTCKPAFSTRNQKSICRYGHPVATRF